MGADSKIQWTHHTFNAWIGCSKVDPLCDNCYAEVETFPRVQRGRGLEMWGPDAHRHITSASNWREPLKWNRAAEAAGERRRVFVNSLSDVCEDRRDLDAPREWLWELIRRCPWLDFMLLTKRPQNIGRFIPQDVLDRIYMGVSAGTVAGLKRVELLMRHRAKFRFVSMEPLLEDVGFDPSDLAYRDDEGRMVDLVIVGGESGRNPRPCHVSWIYRQVQLCQLAGVAPFVKQLGANIRERNDAGFEGEEYDIWDLGERVLDAVEHDPDGYRNDYQGAPVRVHLVDKKGGNPDEWPIGLRIRQMPTEARP